MPGRPHDPAANLDKEALFAAVRDGELYAGPKGPPELEALLDAANSVMRKLYEKLIKSDDEHAQTNADTVHRAWAHLALVNLCGPPLGFEGDLNGVIED